MANPALTLQIFALGPPEVRMGTDLLTFPTRKTLALLFYLAIEGTSQPREHLAAILWPEASSERSYANLRNTLGHLQTAFRQASNQEDTNFLSVTHTTIGLNPEANIAFDLRTVEQAYDLARNDRTSRILPDGAASLPLLEAAAACQRGDFLVGFSLGNAPGFDDWAAIQREVWRRRLGLILDRLSEIQFAKGQFAGATETASRWTVLDTFNEVAYRRKMWAHFAAGERGQAIETFETCQAILATELGVEPEPDTAALAERIRTQSPPAPPQARPVASQPHLPDTSVAFLGNLYAGRSREHQVLIDSYKSAVAGQPQLVILRGERGIGKSRLARKFLAWANVQGAELLQCNAFESGTLFPFRPLVEGLRLLLERDHLPQSVLETLWFSPLRPLLPELSERYPNLPNPPDMLTPMEEVTQVQLFEPFTQFTIALSKEAPLVLFMDDLQWVDIATLDLLQYMIRRWRDIGLTANTQIMLLVSLRSEALHPLMNPQQTGIPEEGPIGLAQWLTNISRDMSPVHIELGLLEERETMQMVLSILTPPAAGFAEWLYTETRGQPFYLMETLKDLLERRVLHPRRRGRQWTFSVEAEHDLAQAVRVPSTVYAVIRSRLNRLSPNAFALLAGGAVLDQQITFEYMCAVTNLGEDQALPALDELLSSRLLLEAVRPGASSAYIFTNDMLRDVIYTEAGDARRRLFHRRALDVIAAEGDSAAVLAYHALAAGLADVAFQYSVAAGQAALRLSAVSEAIVHLERARHLVQNDVLPEMPAKTALRNLYEQLSKAYQMARQVEKSLAIEAEREKLLPE